MPTVEAAKRLDAEQKLATVQEQIAELQNVPPVVEKAFEPKAATPLWVSLVVGVLGSMSPAALSVLPPPWGPIVAILCAGVALGLGTHFGIKSAGVAKPPSK